MYCVEFGTLLYAGKMLKLLGLFVQDKYGLLNGGQMLMAKICNLMLVNVVSVLYLV